MARTKRKKYLKGVQSVEIPQSNIPQPGDSLLGGLSEGLASGNPLSLIASITGGFAGEITNAATHNKKTKLYEARRSLAGAENSNLSKQNSMDINSLNNLPTDMFTDLIAQDGLVLNPMDEATKPVEVEKDELVFRKSGDAFRLVADFIGGELHSTGGEPYSAKPGDVIIPGKKRKEVLKLVDKESKTVLDSLTFKDIANKLPKEGDKAGAGLVVQGIGAGLDLLGSVTSNVASNLDMGEGLQRSRRLSNVSKAGDATSLIGQGTMNVGSMVSGLNEGTDLTSLDKAVEFLGTLKKDGTMPKAENGLVVGGPDYTFGPDPQRLTYEDMQMPDIAQRVSAFLDSTGKTGRGKGNDLVWGPESEPLAYDIESPPFGRREERALKRLRRPESEDNMALADIGSGGLYNLASALLTKENASPEIRRSNLLTPKERVYADVSDPLRKSILSEKTGARKAARSLTGGNIRRLGAENLNASMAYLGALDQVGAKEDARRQTISNLNIGSEETADRHNVDRRNLDMDINDQNRASARNLKRHYKAVLANAIQQTKRDSAISKKDKKLDARSKKDIAMQKQVIELYKLMYPQAGKALKLNF